MSVQAPPLTSVVRPEATVVKHSKSSLRKQTSEERKIIFKRRDFWEIKSADLPHEHFEMVYDRAVVSAYTAGKLGFCR